MVVMKFGGSSVASAAAIARVLAIVTAEHRPRVVVVSALGGVTDTLFSLAARAAAGGLDAALEGVQALRARHASIAETVRSEPERGALLRDLDAGWLDVETLLRAASLLKACTPAASDAIVAHGELASSRLVAALLCDAGVPARWVDARSLVVTDARHQQAAPLACDTTDRLSRIVQPLIGRGAVPVIGGFVGATADGVTTTLGRGGSDYSASLVGACLGAAEIQIWTDVDGMLTADPRIFRRARQVDRLSFREAAALAKFGAKVLHPSTVQPAVTRGIPVRILNARRPAGRGTVVQAGPVRRSAPAAGIGCVTDLCAIDVALPEGAGRAPALAAVFDACARAETAVRLAALSDASVSLVIDDGPAADRVAAALGAYSSARRGGLALLAVVGDALASGSGVLQRVLAALGAAPVHLLSRTPGSNHLACVIDQVNLAEAVGAVHACLFGHAPQPDTGLDQPETLAAAYPAFSSAGREVRA